MQAPLREDDHWSDLSRAQIGTLPYSRQNQAAGSGMSLAMGGRFETHEYAGDASPPRPTGLCLHVYIFSCRVFRLPRAWLEPVLVTLTLTRRTKPWSRLKRTTMQSPGQRSMLARAPRPASLLWDSGMGSSPVSVLPAC